MTSLTAGSLSAQEWNPVAKVGRGHMNRQMGSHYGNAN
jgi:hypothetical protein